MELRDLKKVIELVKQNDLAEFEWQEQDFRIQLKRNLTKEAPVIIHPPKNPQVIPASSTVFESPPLVAKTEEPENNGLEDINSPMVGTFYRSVSPESDSLVSIGTQVDEDSVVCIIEAMKVMNEIKAEKKGVIKKIMVENASPVEFGQILFKIEPL